MVRKLLHSHDSGHGRAQPVLTANATLTGAVKMTQPKPGEIARLREEVERLQAEGSSAAIESHKSIRKSKPKRLYWKFLIVRDACPELSFLKFLVHPDFADIRDQA